MSNKILKGFNNILGGKNRQRIIAFDELIIFLFFFRTDAAISHRNQS